jgi:hypothetical protein
MPARQTTHKTTQNLTTASDASWPSGEDIHGTFLMCTVDPVRSNSNPFDEPHSYRGVRGGAVGWLYRTNGKCLKRVARRRKPTWMVEYGRDIKGHFDLGSQGGIQGI